MINPGSRVAKVAVVAGLSVLVAGCSVQIGGSGDLNTGKLSDEISADIEEALPGVQVDVQCPGDIPLAAGTSFVCDATVAGQTLTFSITQTDDEGNVDSDPEQAVLVLSKINDQVAPQLSEQLGGQWQVNCDPPGAQEGVYVVPPGATFECTFSGTGQNGTEVVDQPMEITVEDTAGNVSWRA